MVGVIYWVMRLGFLVEAWLWFGVGISGWKGEDEEVRRGGIEMGKKYFSL